MSPTPLRLLALVLLLAPRTASAWEVKDAMNPGNGHIELALGYGASVKFESGGGSHEIAVVSPRFGVFLSDPLDEGGALEGVPEMLFQWNYFQEFSPHTRVLLGICPLWRYNFFTWNRIVPFVDAGAGLAYCDFGTPDEGGNWGFQLQGGVGCHFFVGESVALMVECRFHHFSNAHIYTPNIGVNDIIGALGVSFFY
ncbi:MAG TPA: acyloxyacyl hydrolase [Planctomycetota bacterium]|nr:acyloxyacyl hydrolase [Planctomycetota bacterium]